MNREIKFRFWDHEINKMSKSIGIGIIYETLNNYFRKATGNDNYIIDWAKIEIMQYTGLKDKNGVEIYEGDVLKRVTLFEDGGSDVHIGVVEFDSYNFSYYSRSIKNELSRNLCVAPKGVAYEIVGNIHQNPHLLK